MTVHYEHEGLPLCGSAAKNFGHKLTNKKENVTCTWCEKWMVE